MEFWPSLYELVKHLLLSFKWWQKRMSLHPSNNVSASLTFKWTNYIIFHHILMTFLKWGISLYVMWWCERKWNYSNEHIKNSHHDNNFWTLMHESEHNCWMVKINSFIKPFVNSFFYYSLHLQLPPNPLYTMLCVLLALNAKRRHASDYMMVW